jgi:import inner membrane translocase subunit TIM16
MAIGPLIRMMAQVVVPVVAVLARALPAAYAQALRNARGSGAAAEAAVSSIARNRMARDEALQILNVSNDATPEMIRKVSLVCLFVL